MSNEQIIGKLDEVLAELVRTNSRLENIEVYLERQGTEKEVGKVEKPTVFNDEMVWKESKFGEYVFTNDKFNPESSAKLRKLVEEGHVLFEMQGKVFEVKISKDGVFFNRRAPKVK